MSAAAVRLRKMTPADVRAILAIDEKIVGEQRSASWKQRIARYLEVYYPPVCHVAEVGGKVIGFIFGDVRSWEYGLRAGGWIDIMGVDTDYQGQGIGHMLVEAFVEQCRQEGIDTVHIMVREEDNPMQDFFRSLGFQRGKLMELVKSEGSNPAQ